MLQYIPENWPYDNKSPSKQGNKSSVVKWAVCLVVISRMDIARQPLGCFKAKQMAWFGEHRMYGHI